jgi:regulator of protease activity HflC (stomatin/prohibitin superfamily)
MIRESDRSGIPGLPMLFALLAASVLATYAMIGAFRDRAAGEAFAWMALDVVVLVCLGGLFIVNPNEGRVMQLFGAYRGTAKTAGLRWANPFYSKRHISLRVRNFESTRLKVNDSDGNPVEIAAVVVWRVVDTAEAVFEVDNYENYVKVQSEAAVRNLATRYPYDAQEHETSLRGSTASVAKDLQHEIQERLAKAGVEVIEARISHLAYAPEIAAAMLRRQQAGAIIAARQKIVEGAVGMVDMALAKLAESTQVRLDEERKAAMVSNLLVVLCADREAQPVINTGTLYQ